MTIRRLLPAKTCHLTRMLVGVSVFYVHASFAQPVPSAPDMLERVLPSVVTVAVHDVQGATRPFGFASDPIAAAYERALDLAGVPTTGSGFIIERGGKLYVVTNAHVIENATEDKAISVYGIDQTSYPVKVVGGDSFFDVAVLEIVGGKPRAALRNISFKKGEPRIGETVYAIGTPLGQYPYTVTQGIIGGKNRVLDGLTGKFGYLQSTATVTIGNSGGPLVDANGYVVGVNTKIAHKQPQINFALEARRVQRVIDDVFTNNGRVRRPYFGVEVIQRYRREDMFGRAWVPEDLFPVLADVIPGSPAASVLAGREGSRIIEINDFAVRNTQEVLGALEDIMPGKPVRFVLERSGKREIVSFTSGELTHAALGEIARFFMSRHASKDIRQEKGGVVLSTMQPESQLSRGARQATPQREYYLFERESGRYKKARGGTSEVMLVGVGRIFDADDWSIWRVSNIAELGVAIRLAALSGVVDFVPVANGVYDAERLVLSDDEEVVVETVLY